ncbi:long-chain acyl-CoA synthetase [Constrictibacter sp. MBR-5]|jgi:long-chain acyl-CoA synthetase|uniref:AMP-binding protein n=1 Tax=Constrictibacter sp. MBR-5 TaxID=3156467 RepID=UPI003394AA5D
MTPGTRNLSENWSLTALLDALAARGGEAALVTVAGDALTATSAAELAGDARRLAAGLVAAGAARGEHVGLIAPNGPDWAVARLGIAAAGCVGVALDDLAGEEEAATYLKDAGCRLVFVSPAHLPVAERLGIDALVLDDGAAERHERSWRLVFAEEIAGLPELRPEDRATLVYTSGTTGAPKSFYLTWANIAANVEAMVSLDIVRPGDRVLLPLPLHHVYPLVVGLFTPLSGGGAVVFPEAVAGPQIIRALQAAGVAIMIGVPRLYTALVGGLEGRVAARGKVAKTLFRALVALSDVLRRRFGIKAGRVLLAGLHRQIGPELRVMISGGAQLEPAVFHRLEALGWEVLSGYGLAETASIFTGNVPGAKIIGSEGRPLKGGEIRIAPPLAGETGSEGAGEGEILLRGASVFAGYRDNPEANATAFTEDGWFRTGDLGRLDDKGFVYVTGRSKELIVLGGGKNVFPDELEKVYGDSPYFRELAVLERNGALVAIVVPDAEAMRASGYTRAEDVVRITLADKARGLPSYQRLSGFAVSREPLPRTRLGKYQRFRLGDLYERARRGETRPRAVAPSPEDRGLIAGGPAAEVWKILTERYAERGLSMDASPTLDLGIDSLEWMTLALDVEQRAGVALTEEDLAASETVRDLLGRVGTAADRPAVAAVSAEDLRWFEPVGPAGRAFGTAAFATNRALMRLLFRVEVEGLEHLPAEGPCVLAANHASDLDPPVMGAALPLDFMRRVYWGGDAQRLHGGPIRRALMRPLHVFPVDERTPAAALAMGTEALKRGNALIWFPESWRSPDGEIQRFLPGIGRLLSETGAPVLPVWIDGTFAAMPRGRSLPRPTKVRIRIGPPLDAAALEARGDGDNPYTRIAAALRDEVAKLKP